MPYAQVFYVIEGAVTFEVHESSYILCTGGMIIIPRGNSYYIENITERVTRLFFAQMRRVATDEEQPPDIQPAPRSSGAGRRPSSERPTPGPKKRAGSRAQ
jgi:centromere protein C